METRTAGPTTRPPHRRRPARRSRWVVMAGSTGEGHEGCGGSRVVTMHVLT